MSPDKLHKKTKVHVMTLVTLAILVASVILALTQTVAIHVSVILGLITVIVPSYCSLYYYKGKWASLFLVISCFAIMFALIYAVDMSASANTARSICDRLYVNNTIFRDAESIRCTSLNEGGFTTNIVSSSFGAVVFLPFTLITLLNTVNILVLFPSLLGRWVRKR